MKKILLVLFVGLLLTGCGAQETMETVCDIYAVPASVTTCQVQLSLPDEAVLQSMEADDGSRMYMCDGYTVTVQTMEAGDLDRTLRIVSGFTKEKLTLMRTKADGITRYESAWCAAGETEEQICRGLILDDGNYHYAVTIMANYSVAGEKADAWQHILDSACLVSTD